MSETMNDMVEPQIKRDIIDIYHHICQAFSELDINTALSYFSDSVNMIKISNGTKLTGKKQLAEYWGQSFEKNNEVRISIENVDIFKIDENHVWTTADENISIAGQHQKAIVTNIFTLTASGWKILLDHTTYLQAD